MFRTTWFSMTCALAVAAMTLSGCGQPTSTPVDEPTASTPEAERFVLKVGAEPAALGSTERVHSCQGVLLASQPAAPDFAVLADQGYRSVLNLRSEPEMTQLDFDERELLEEQGLNYYHVGFAGADELTDDIFDRTRQILNDSENHPILVHCASANRVGAVWLAHRVIDHGLDYDAALEEAKTIGLRSDALEELARDYIARHQDAA